MKKVHIILLVVLAFAVGFVLGDRSWLRMRFSFGATVITPRLPDSLDHFRVSGIPAFSSQHYFYREGFGDVDECWSFCLPPEYAKKFLAAYTKKTGMPLIEDTSDIPDWVIEITEQDTWDGRYWFSAYSEFDQIYYKDHLFCGYSADKNRIYMMNWND